MGGFLGHRRVWRGYRVEIKRLEKLKLLCWRHERVLHQLVESLEALDIDAHSVLVAVAGTIKSILLSKTESAQVTHGCLKANIVRILPFWVLAAVETRSGGLAIAQGNMALTIEVLYLATVVGTANQMGWVVVAQD